MAKEKTVNQELEEKLFRKKDTAWQASRKEAFDFAEKYKEFIAQGKTERAATKLITALLVKQGFKDINAVKELKQGDKVYMSGRGKSILCAVIGKDATKLRLIGAHIDSPRLDLKPNPMYESTGMALFKTHYYGGIKKYQWTNVDLALYGIIHTKDGKKLEFNIGEAEDDPRFIVSDLLPHLAKKQMEKPGNELIEAEQLNVFVGNIPVDDKDVKEKVKFNILKILNDKYGLVEEDLSFAELNFVPAGVPRDIGFDKSLIAGYGQDDKACSYAALMAFLEAKNTDVTNVAYLSDKEEIGSIGNTGAYSFVLVEFAETMAKKLGLGITAHQLLAGSRAISADVSSGMDPNFPEVHDEKNASLVGYGVVIEKYTGSGGKYSANDASAEYMAFIRKMLDAGRIRWQAAELGKVDLGGGGTIALYLSRFGIDTVDAGPAVLGMHSPREVLSKIDLYESYRLYKAFYEN